MLYGWLPWLGRTYNDTQLALRARITIADDPLLTDVMLVSITSAKGVICLKGRVPHASDKARIEGAIRTALHTADLPYARLVNALQASAAGPTPPEPIGPHPSRHSSAPGEGALHRLRRTGTELHKQISLKARGCRDKRLFLACDLKSAICSRDGWMITAK